MHPEFTAPLLLAATEIDSDFMAKRSSNGNDAIALLVNTVATSAGLALIVRGQPR